MRIIENLKEMTETARGWLASGTVGFVPIKSTIHDGHRLLIEAAQSACEITVVGLLDKIWPFDKSNQSRQIQMHNIQQLNRYNIDVVFAPRVEDMYPGEFATYVAPRGVILERMSIAEREGILNFATLAIKVSHLVRPDVIYYGQKDVQQVAVMRQLVRDLNIDVRINVLPTVRESDGLAISSRNSSLSEAERSAAPLIYQALLNAKALIENGEFNAFAIKQAMVSLLETNPLITIERIDICTPDTLRELPEAVPSTLLLVDAHIGAVRLNDNIIWEKSGQWIL